MLSDPPNNFRLLVEILKMLSPSTAVLRRFVLSLTVTLVDPVALALSLSLTRRMPTMLWLA